MEESGQFHASAALTLRKERSGIPWIGRIGKPQYESGRYAEQKNPLRGVELWRPSP
jgi:hypothetical protein